jgi:hypothetical protein
MEQEVIRHKHACAYIYAHNTCTYTHTHTNTQILIDTYARMHIYICTLGTTKTRMCGKLVEILFAH